MKRSFATYLIACALFLVLAGCRPSANDCTDFVNIDPDGWAYTEPVNFALNPADSVATGALTLSLRHTNDYLYSNVYLEVSVRDSLSTRVDTLNIVLADNFGRWHGRGIGTDFQITDTVAPRLTIHRPAHVSVRHIMRVDRLTDIEQVGIAFTELPN